MVIFTAFAQYQVEASFWVNTVMSLIENDPTSCPHRTLAQPFKNIELKPLLFCVLGIVVLLDGDPLDHSEATNTLKKVFLSRISMFLCIHLSFNSNQLSCRWSWKTQHHADTTMLHSRDGIRQAMRSARCLPHIPLRIKQVQFWSHHTRELYFSESRSPFGVVWQSQCRLCVLHRGEASGGPLCPLQWRLSF